VRGCQVAKYTLPRVDPKLTTLCPKGEEIAPTPAPGWLLSRIGFSPRTLGRPLPPGHHQSTLPAHLSRPLRLDRPLAVHVITLSDTIYRLWCSEAQTTPIVDATHRPRKQMAPFRGKNPKEASTKFGEVPTRLARIRRSQQTNNLVPMTGLHLDSRSTFHRS
jgi:hypothetical protein